MRRIKGSSIFTAIKLADDKAVPKEIQILKVGKFSHPQYGNFEITTTTLAEMIANFKLNVRGVDLAVDYYHNSDQEAAAWFNDLQLRENGTELWADVTWTPKASQMLSEREIRYFSPDFAFKWTDPESNVIYSNVLFGGGLTNRPFLKEMKAIVADELNSKGVNMTELEKLEARVKESEAKMLKLAEDNSALAKKCDDMQAALPKPGAAAPGAAPANTGKDVPAGGADDVASLKKQIADLQAQLAKAQQDSDMAMAEKNKAVADAATATAAKQMAEKTQEFNVMLSEGKAVAAQRDAFLKGDMAAFVKLAQPINLKGLGSVELGAPAEGSSEEKIIKLAEEKRKANPKLKSFEAISLAKKELKL